MAFLVSLLKKLVRLLVGKHTTYSLHILRAFMFGTSVPNTSGCNLTVVQ